MVGDLGLQIGGGSRSPVLFFLRWFGITIGANKVLGEEFASARATFVISKADTVQLIKATLVCTNLVAPGPGPK